MGAPFVPRECPFGHGPMETLVGWWALQGVDVRTPQQSLAAGGPERITIRDNGNAYAVRARRCRECGLVLLFDEEVR